MTLDECIRLLAHAGIDDPKTDAGRLICHFEGVSPALLYAQRERDYTGPALYAAVKRRQARVPLQHILGEEYFYGERYEVSADVLIPRADTECLVEAAIHLLPPHGVFADLCTGSGCVAISVLAHRRDLTAIGVDISERALETARRNAKSNGVADRITLIRADLLKENPHLLSSVSYFLSNPPYIQTDVIDTLAPELAFEPSLALDGGEDGLTFYRRFLDIFSPSLFLFEIGYDQGDALRAMGKAHGYAVTVEKDASGNDRLAILTKRMLGPQG